MPSIRPASRQALHFQPQPGAPLAFDGRRHDEAWFPQGGLRHCVIRQCELEMLQEACEDGRLLDDAAA